MGHGLKQSPAVLFQPIRFLEMNAHNINDDLLFIYASKRQGGRFWEDVKCD